MFFSLTLCYLDRTQEIMAKTACFAFSRSCVSPVLIAPECPASFNTHLHGTLCWKAKSSHLCNSFLLCCGTTYTFYMLIKTYL